MLGKCANPVCHQLFRKLGNGKLFAFESVACVTSANLTSETSSTNPRRSPAFFWLCETCSVTLTLIVDSEGQLMLRTCTDNARVTIFTNRPLSRCGFP